MADVEGFLEALSSWDPVHKVIVDRRTATRHLLSLRVVPRRSSGTRRSETALHTSPFEDTLRDGSPPLPAAGERDALLMVYSDCQTEYYSVELSFESETKQKPLGQPWGEYFTGLRDALGRSGNIIMRFDPADNSKDLLDVTVAVPGRAVPCTFQLLAQHDPAARAQRIAALAFDMAVSSTRLQTRLKAGEQQRTTALEAELQRERAKVAALQAQLRRYGDTVPPSPGTQPGSPGPGGGAAEGRKRKAPKSLFAPAAKVTVPQGAKIKPTD